MLIIFHTNNFKSLYQNIFVKFLFSNESTKKKVCEYVLNEALNLVGNAMTYSLFEGVKEKYLDLIVVDETDCKLSPDSPEDNVRLQHCLGKLQNSAKLINRII